MDFPLVFRWENIFRYVKRSWRAQVGQICPSTDIFRRYSVSTYIHGPGHIQEVLLRIKIIETNSFEKGSSLLVSWPARLFSFRLHWIVLKSSLHTGVVSSFIMVTVESFLDRRGIWNQEKWVKHEKLFVPLFLENLHCRQKNLDQFAEWDYIISNVGLGCFPSRVETELMEQWCYIYYCDMVRGE